MTTTTGDPSSLKTPASLSGGDLVSRLLAATPPYLYNVPLTPHSFFFSEMLRSFVQAKAEATSTSTTNQPSGVARRRKRSWRDARERPLELTTKDKTAHHHHHSHHSQHPHHHSPHPHHHHSNSHPHAQSQQQQQPKEKYFQMGQSQPEAHLENRFKAQHSLPNESPNYPQEITSTSISSSLSNSNNNNNNNNKIMTNQEQKTGYSITEPLKSLDDNRPDFSKQSRDFYDDSSRRFTCEKSIHQDALFAAAAAAAAQKIKPEEPQQPISSPETESPFSPDRSSSEERANKLALSHEIAFANDQKIKLPDFGGRNFLPSLAGPGRLDEAKNFPGLAALPAGTDFLPSGPLWYPPYPNIAQSYPGIDPLHFFIDLRVSGHIWDRKMNERQMPFKSKHCSAFSVPQAKEYNRPLDLTRDEAASSSSSSANNGHSSGNLRGTHFIMKNLTDTYREIRDMEKVTNRAESIASNKSSSSSDDTSNKDFQGTSLSMSDTSSGGSPSSSRDNRQATSNETKEKDLRALIGLELVVDYVKEPKENAGPANEKRESPDVAE